MRFDDEYVLADIDIYESDGRFLAWGKTGFAESRLCTCLSDRGMYGSLLAALHGIFSSLFPLLKALPQQGVNATHAGGSQQALLPTLIYVVDMTFLFKTKHVILLGKIQFDKHHSIVEAYRTDPTTLTQFEPAIVTIHKPGANARPSTTDRNFDLTKIVLAAHRRTDMRLAKRWNCVGINGATGPQFNVYRKENGYFLTFCESSGAETTELFHIKGGDFRTLMEAYMRASSFLSDFVIASRAIGGDCTAMVMVDSTTHPWVSFAVFEANDGVGAMETRTTGFTSVFAD